MISNKLMGLVAIVGLAGAMGFTSVGCSDSGSGDDDSDGGSSGGSSGKPSSSSGGSSGGSSSGKPVVDGGGSSSGEPEACLSDETLGFPFPAATEGQNKCPDALWAQAKTACFDDAATAQTCTAFRDANAANAACLTCVAGGEATDPYPVLVPIKIGGTDYNILNVNGCIAAVAGVSGDCAETVSNISVCVYGNCEECDAESPPSAENSPKWAECLDQAEASDSACKPLIDAGVCLENESADSGVTDAEVTAACGTNDDEFDVRLDKIVRTLCGAGGPAVDGGTGDGG